MTVEVNSTVEALSADVTKQGFETGVGELMDVKVARGSVVFAALGTSVWGTGLSPG